MAAIMANENSLTGDYLFGRRQIEVPKKRHKADGKRTLSISGASGNNLQNVTGTAGGLAYPVQRRSGSGKSTLINGTLQPLAATALNGATTLRVAAPSDVMDWII